MTDQKRMYNKRRRADGEAKTRLRITESAVALHGSVGPSRTSVAAVAARAGVRRSTVYRHFPDEASLFDACTAHWMKANPLPDIATWATVADRDERVRKALADLYRYYRRADQMLYNMHRDEVSMPSVRERFAAFHEFLAAARAVVVGGGRAGARARVRAAVGHALSYTTWRSLVGEQRLSEAQAIDLMAQLVATAERPRASARAAPLTRSRSAR